MTDEIAKIKIRIGAVEKELASIRATLREIIARSAPKKPRRSAPKKPRSADRHREPNRDRHSLGYMRDYMRARRAAQKEA
jgi:hypothetical protein